MIAFFFKYRKPIFIATVATFLVGIFVGLGAYAFTASADSIGEVRGRKLSYKQFIMQVNRIDTQFRNSGTETTDVLKKTIYQEVFKNMVVDELMHQEAEKAGLVVTDFEVAAEIQNTPAFNDGGRFNPRAYYQAISTEFGMTPEEYEKWRKYDRLVSKYKEYLMTNVKVTPDEVKAFAAAVGSKNFEKDKGTLVMQLSKAKFNNIGNYMLSQIAKGQDIKSYVDKRMGSAAM